MRRLLLVFLCLPVLSQTTNFKHFGIVNENWHLGSIESFCGVNDEIKVFKGQILDLTNYFECSYKQYYQLYHNGKKLYIESEYLTVIDSSKYELESMNSQFRDSANVWAERDSKDYYNLEIKKAKELYNKTKNCGIAITSWDFFDESEYTNGTGYNINFSNSSDKTIKYVWITLNAYNPVNDFISTKTIKCVGPLKPDNIGNYVFNYVWGTDMVDKVKLKNIKIQYMDGTFKVASKPSDAYISERCAYLLFGEY